MQGLWFLACLVWPNFLFAQVAEFEAYGPRFESSYQLDRSAFFPDGGLSLEELGAMAQEAPSYPQFLQGLQDRRPQLFQNYVLIHESGSLQFASRERPRVILFGDGLLLSFAEDPRKAERTIEVLALDPKTLLFRMAELKFPSGTQGASFEADVARCQTCHGKPAKPLWEPYDFWPNAYASNIGRFATQREKELYLALKGRARDGIYAYLSWYPVPPNTNRSMPGIEAFTQYVTQLQAMSVFSRWAREKPEIKIFLPALIASLQGCGAGADDTERLERLASFFPFELQARLRKEFVAWHQEISGARRRFKAYQIERYRRLFPAVDHPYVFAPNPERIADEVPSFAQFLWVLKQAGLKPQELSLSQGANPYFLSVPSNIDFDLIANLSLVAPDLYRRLSPDLSPAPGYSYQWVNFSCDALREESLLRLSNRTLPEGTPKTEAPTVLGLCMECHTQSPQKGPFIPFDRTEALRTYLFSNGAKAYGELLRRIQSKEPGRMPPNRSLTPEEKTSLETNLEALR